MADLDDIHRDLAAGNLGALVSMRQRQQSLQKQEEIAALLRGQKQEQDRVRQLPQCPQCGTRVEEVAKICPSCRTPLLVLTDIKLRDSLPYAVALNARNVQHELIEVYQKALAHERKLDDELRQQGDSLQVLCQRLTIALQPPVSEYIEALGAIANRESRARSFVPTFLRMALGFILWVGSGILGGFFMDNVHKSAMENPTNVAIFAIAWFIGAPVAIATLFHFFFHSHRGRARVVAQEGLRKCFASNPALHNLIDVTNKSGEDIQNYLASVGDEVESSKAIYDTLLNRLRGCRKVENTVRAFAVAHNVAIPQVRSSRNDRVLHPLPALTGDRVEEIRIRLGEVLKAIERNGGMKSVQEETAEMPAGTRAMGASGSSNSMAENGAQLWLRSPSDKVSGPFSKSQVAKAMSLGKIPDGTKAGYTPEGPWQVIKKPRGT